MKLASTLFNEVLFFEEGFVNSIIIENQKCFYNFLKDIQAQIEGNEGCTVLSKENIPVSFAKNAEVIDSFLSFDLNKKTLVNKIINQLEKNSLESDMFYKGGKLLGEIENYVDDLAAMFPFRLEYEKLNIIFLLKAIGINVADDADSDIERIINYIEIVKELEGDKLFIFVNMRSYFSDEDMIMFCKDAILHKDKILLVEGTDRKRLPTEKRLLIDEDLCEI